MLASAQWSSRTVRRPAAIRVQAPADAGGRLRIAALGSASARAPRGRRRDRAHLPRRARRARRPARPPLRGRRRPARRGRLARARGRLGRGHVAGRRACATGAASATWRASSTPLPARDELAAEARVGILGLAWRLGISPEETAAIHAEAHDATGRAAAADERFGWTLLRRDAHAQRPRAGGARGVPQRPRAAVAAGDPGRGADGVHGRRLRELDRRLVDARRCEAIDHALELAGGDPRIGAGLAFVCPLAHAFGQRGQCHRLHGRARSGAPGFRPRDRAGARARRPRDEVRRPREPRAPRSGRRGARGGARQRRARPRDRRAGGQRDPHHRLLDARRCGARRRGTLRRRARAG